jgi:hypothetical protein
LAEWSIATALKAVRPLKGLGGSNPSPAATHQTIERSSHRVIE